MKTILVCCGSGVATSPQVTNKVNEYLASVGLDGYAKATPKPIETAKSTIESDPSIIVYIGIAPANKELQEVLDEHDVVGMVGLPWLTGMGQDEANERIKEIVEKYRLA
ncbi:phosphotransferase system protein [Streptococcus criceti]|uniref:PTS system galactitol-specific enzyme IIB component family protein n=1 Tax=Streptococcus criceti HS-6 TaxID=873449 RepID=G5JTK4_STRCG|nr:PTS galactitol enzyme IIB component family protein [Streptococcus criceti]EHI73935.1 PTS system galactitol-specific enzyme IIB component family protein [Streptococcus criceti HS-6]SUN37676.1 phosphotransferase system protein [Streptococcus criceti]